MRVMRHAAEAGERGDSDGDVHEQAGAEGRGALARGARGHEILVVGESGVGEGGRVRSWVGLL